jgi:uncharacterized protein YraI
MPAIRKGRASALFCLLLVSAAALAQSRTIGVLPPNQPPPEYPAFVSIPQSVLTRADVVIR